MSEVKTTTEAIDDETPESRSAPCSSHCYTAGPWRVGDGSFVIAESPSPGIRGSDDVKHYGGHLICESVSSSNAKLIAVAPEMRDLLATIENDNEQVPRWLWDRIQDVLARSV